MGDEILFGDINLVIGESIRESFPLWEREWANFPLVCVCVCEEGGGDSTKWIKLWGIKLQEKKEDKDEKDEKHGEAD